MLERFRHWVSEVLDDEGMKPVLHIIGINLNNLPLHPY